MNVSPTFAARSLGAVALVCLLFATPATVAAHAELTSSSPADGAVLTGSPDEIVMTYSEAMDPSKSSITLHGADGTEIARGGVDPDNDTVMRMTPPELDPGAYEIRSTSAALDGHIEHAIVRFTISEPTPSPSPSPTPEPSATPTASASTSTSPAASPSPSAGGDQTTTTNADLLIPILAVIVLVAVLGAMLLRGRARGGGAA